MIGALKLDANVDASGVLVRVGSKCLIVMWGDYEENHD